MKQALRPFWSRLFRYGWKFGLVLILAVCIPRFAMVLHANVTGNYGSIAVIMTVSALVPFIFLGRYGRRKMGITRPEKPWWLPVAFISGIVLSLILYLAGKGLYGGSIENWYIYIGNTYSIPPGISRNDRLIMFALTALTGMIFSPIGEELFFRGIVHSSFASSVGERNASLADASAFALTHVAHFGLLYTVQGWKFPVMPALIWISAMFLVSLLFIRFKFRSGSILGAILCHAGFNLGMIFSIFYLL